MAPKPPHARIVSGSQGSSEFAAVITTSGRAVSCSSHPHLSQHHAAASTPTFPPRLQAQRRLHANLGYRLGGTFSSSVLKIRCGAVSGMQTQRFGVDLPNSVYSDGTLIYENTILTKISGYAHVLAWSTSTLVVIIVADAGERTPATMSDIGRGEP